MSKRTNVTLERFFINDAEAYFQIANDKSLIDFFDFAYCENIEDAKLLMEAFTLPDYFVCKVINENDTLVGLIFGEPTSYNRKRLSVSYFIGSDYRKKGYCVRALKKFIKLITNKTRYNGLEFTIDPKNEASIGVMESIDALLTMHLIDDSRGKEWFVYLKKAMKS